MAREVELGSYLSELASRINSVEKVSGTAGEVRQQLERYIQDHAAFHETLSEEDSKRDAVIKQLADMLLVVKQEPVREEQALSYTTIDDVHRVVGDALGKLPVPKNHEPDYQFSKGELRFKQPDGQWGAWFRLGAGGGGKGDKGDAGPQGAQGEAGAQGAQGIQGVQGDVGATGSTGPTGPAGATGATGPTGAAGSNGTNGADGAVGATGATGATGTAVAMSMMVVSGTPLWGLPSRTIGTTVPAVVAAALNGVWRYSPFRVDKTITVTAMGIYVSTVGTGECRLAIVAADSNLQPTGAVIVEGSINTNSGGTGEKTLVVSQVLTPGWYLLISAFDNATVRCRAMRFNQLFGNWDTAGNISTWQTTTGYPTAGAWGSPPAAITTVVNTTGQSTQELAALRWTA